jgi:hypothetical protein
MQNQFKVIDNKTWLKQYWARESTYSTYPKDCNLPICTLTQYGLFYDSIRKSFRCSECTFEYANIFTDSLDDLLSKHYKHLPTCSYSVLSLELSLNFSLNKLDIIEPTKSNLSNYKLESVNETDSNKKLKLIYQSEESRLKTFENIRLMIDTKQLVSNGFYRVVKNSNSSFLNKSDTVDNIQFDEKQSHLAKIANALDSKLIHIRCVYCSYECILFKNYHLNTFLKSPFDEHKEKSAKKCPIFNNETSDAIDLTNTNELITDFKTTILKYQERLKWLQCLYDFEKDESNSEVTINALQMLSNSENFKQLNDVEVKQLPKILEHLNLLYLNNLDTNEAANNSSSNTAIVYVPGVSTTNSGSITATSDFNKLQNVLGLSDSVISERAYHPAYTSYQARLETYKEWPATLSQQPNDLAKAGFYYFGIKDMVKCFFCNGGLKNWDHNDDPYQDHVRWFPKCQFIRQLMGAEYVEQVREKYKNMDSGFTNEYINNTNSNNKSNGSILSSRSNSSLFANDKRNTRRPVSPRTLNSRLDMHIVRKIVDTNLITRDSLKQAIEMKLSVSQQVSETSNPPPLPVTGSIYGDDFKTPIEMARLAYDLDKMRQDKQDLYKSLSDFVIFNLPNQINIDCVRQFFTIKYCLNPSKIRYDFSFSSFYFLFKIK